MTCEHLHLVPDRRDVTKDVAHVRVLRDQLQRALFSSTTDQDRRTVLLDGSRKIQRTINAVVAALEGRRLLPEHRPADLKRFFETAQPFTDRRELVTITAMFVLVPGGADTKDRASGGDDIEGSDHLRQERRVAIGHARHECAQPDFLRARREPGEHRVTLEHRLSGWSDARQLIEVIHDEDRIEAGPLGGGREHGHVVEQAVVRHTGESEIGNLQSEQLHRLTSSVL